MDIIYFNCSPKEVNRQNLKNDREGSGEGSLLGEGVFGVCSRKLYRGINVAVKQFKENVSLSLVKHEASILAKMDYPGNHYMKVPVVQRLDNAIQQINPVDTVMHLSNNLGQYYKQKENPACLELHIL